MDKDILELTIIEQRDSFENKKEFLKRSLDSNICSSKKIIVISGIRRCGKSTLLKQISNNYSNYYYLNFEDERLIDFDYKDFNVLLEIFFKLYGEQKIILFDEIQNIFGWEKFVRRLFEDGYKIFITGSNAKLLSSEIATTLTGRNLTKQLFPFSFKECLEYNNFEIKEIYLTKEKSKLMKHLNKYFQMGGFPEVVKSDDVDELKQLYQDTIIKDLLVRFKIRETKAFRELVLYLISNITNKISYNNLKVNLGFSSTTSVKNYVDFLEEVYLLFSLNKFDYSVKKQMSNDRKIYCIDCGLVNANSFKFTEERGKILENIVFLELKRKNLDIYYHGGLKECDFVVKEGTKITSAIQVCDSMDLIETRKREVSGLIDAMKSYKLKEGIIITYDTEDEFFEEGFKIQVVPIWKYLTLVMYKK